MNKLAIFAALAAPVLFSSCSDKGYWEEYVPDGVEYAIITANQSYTLNPESKGIAPFTLLITRGTTAGDVSVPVSVISEKAYLKASAPATVDFVDGSSEAYITVSFAPDFDAAPWFNPTDSLMVKLGTESIAPSGSGEWKAKVTFANSAEVGKAQLKSQLLGYIKREALPEPPSLTRQSPYGRVPSIPHIS